MKFTREIVKETIDYILNKTPKEFSKETRLNKLLPKGYCRLEYEAIHQINDYLNDNNKPINPNAKKRIEEIESKDIVDICLNLLEEPTVKLYPGFKKYELRSNLITNIYQLNVFPKLELKYNEIGYNNKFEEKKRKNKFKSFKDKFDPNEYDKNQLLEMKNQLIQITRYEVYEEIINNAQSLINIIDNKNSLGQLTLTEPDTTGALSKPLESGLAIVDTIEPQQELSWYQRLKGIFT
jgi:hypothetical protein